MEIHFNTLDRQFKMFQKDYENKAIEVLRSGWYVLGEEVKKFESEFAGYIGCKYAVGVGSGLDALVLAFKALNICEGDEVIVQANTYIASVMGITMNGATPVFVECDEYYNIDVSKIEEKITDKTKAILVVHLYGQATRMKAIQDICSEHKLFLVEDCAQCHGATYEKQKCGTFGDISCWSFYPSKNLGAFGDAGAITTDSCELSDKVKVLRNYGSEKRYHNQVVGYNSRLDELQAGLLRVKLDHLEELLKDRERIALRYLNGINNKWIELPRIAEGCSHVWHLFVIRSIKRDELNAYLAKNKIQAFIHYPIPPHLSQAYAYLNHRVKDFPISESCAENILSLPLFNGMNNEEIDYVIEVINMFGGMK